MTAEINYEKNHTMPTRRDIFLGVLRDKVLTVDEMLLRIPTYPEYAHAAAYRAIEIYQSQ
ncbi:hypothetical protein SerAS12_1035 [Serratia sp. AS12]|uniref:hypothetical protein n=1 Tax=Serratia TaxID=613 RepID=UPI00020E9222|nr:MULTISPECIES: hypothetical protein [Serratia]AEF44186.1 hypothetical protein SerAS9_1035 [Serratia plymuthica AS9]AEF49138.1 hypothetical protein SerAS12_1035 [Serratia sp. AS12]AEG26846.1 hypothetical protein SerAS13_1035 [Serratia sp. AS13]UTN97718.1 hypothetical protein NLX81_05365 [Serratia plymuthica]